MLAWRGAVRSNLHRLSSDRISRGGGALATLFGCSSTSFIFSTTRGDQKVSGLVMKMNIFLKIITALDSLVTIETRCKRLPDLVDVQSLFEDIENCDFDFLFVVKLRRSRNGDGQEGD